MPLYSPKFFAHEIISLAKNAANKALELNPQNAEAFSVIGSVATYFEWDWEAAEEAFNKSLELTHDDAEIYNFFGDYYRVVQHPILAIEMESRALELDPLHPVKHMDLGIAYAIAGDWENALRYAKSASGLSLRYAGKNQLLMRIYIELGRLEEAENAVAGLDDNDNDNDNDNNNNYYKKLYYNTIMAIAKGESDNALSYIELLVNEAENLRNLSSRIGRLYLDLGMFEEAAYWLEKAYENREFDLVGSVWPRGFILPENLPDHPALQAALDKPELNALFEIRRKNLGLTNKKP
jgi:tetratricopeptide (TPR) repeat protein